MATQSNWTGFSSGLGLNAESENIIRSSFLGFGNNGFLRYSRTTSGASTDVTFTNWTQIGTVTDGQSAGYRTRVVMRLPTVAPNVARSLWHTVGGASSYQKCGVLIDTDRTLKCWTNIVSGGPYTTGTASAAIPLGYANNGGWVTVDILAEIEANGVNDVMTVTADITFADGTTEQITHTTGATNLSTPNLSNYGLLGVPATAGFTTNWIGCIDIGQWIQHGASNADFASLPTLPAVGTRHAEVLIDAQGANNGIAYSSGATFRSMRKAFSLATISTDSRLTTTTAGQQSDFSHDGVARFGATQTYGIKVIQFASAGGSPTSQFMIGGSNVAGRGTLSGTADPDYTDFTTRTQATFDALEVGVQSALSSGSYHCAKIQIEVLHNGSRVGDEELVLGDGYQHEWFSWTGNSGLRTLTGASFRPQFALIFSPGTAVAPKVVSVLYPDTTLGATGTWNTEEFFGFTNDGMVVGGTLNTTSQEYVALLIRDDGSPVYDVSGPTPTVTGYNFYFTQGSYGATPSEPVNFGDIVEFTPEAVFVFPANAAGSPSTLMKTRDMGTNLCTKLTVAETPATTLMTSLDANGFTTGSTVSGQVSATIPCLWFAWSDATELYDLIRTREISAVTDANSAVSPVLLKDYKFTFEEDADVSRATLGTVSHNVQATGSPTSLTITSHTIDSGSNRLLVVTVITYGDTGTPSCTYDGGAMTKIQDVDNGFQRVCVFTLDAPAVGSGDVVFTSTTSKSSISMTAVSWRDTSGVRWSNTDPDLTLSYSARLKDVVFSHLGTDPLDTGGTITAPTGWTEIYNDGTGQSAAGAAAWINGSNGEVTADWTFSSSDVISQIVYSVMPVGLPAWNPKIAWVKGNQTNASIARLRLDTASYSGTSCSTWTTLAIASTNGLTAMDDYGFDIYRTSTSDPLRNEKGWAFAIGNNGSILALSPPTSVDDAYSTPYQTALSVPVGTGVLANDNSNGGGAMTALLVANVGVGTLSLASDGSFTYTPPAGYQGTTTFTYRAANSGGNGTIATVTITVSAQTSTAIPVIVEMCFGGSYRNWVKSHANVLAHYYLSDVNSPVAQDEIATGDAGTYTGSPVNGRGILPEYGLSTRFDGATQYATLDWDGFGLGADEAFSIACLVRVVGLGAIQCLVSGTSTGLWLGLDATNHFSFGKNGGTKATSAATVAVDETYLVVGTYDGTNARLYVGRIDTVAGVALVAGPTAVSIGPNGGADVYIARNNSEEFEGDIQGVALFSAALSLGDIEELYETTVWTDVSDDVRAQVPVVTDRGIHTDKPGTRLAPTGTATFALNNAHDNTGEVLGYYSPDHVDVRPGFGRGIPVRIWLDEALQFIGVIRDIKPTSGRWRDRLSYIFCTDWMDEAARFKLKGIPTQENVTADEVFDLILNEMENKPHEIDIALGSDEYVIALDNSKDEEATAHQEFGNLALSELGFVYVTGDGTLTFENRATRLNGTTAFTLDNLMVEAEAEHSTDQLVNSVKVTVHPRRVDAAATTELYTTDNRIRVDNGANPEMFLQFRDPTQEAARVGGLDVVTPVATTDYTFNTAEDGSGTNLTGNPNITINFQLSSNGVYVTVLNNYGQPVYLDIRVRGKGVYDYAPVTLIASDAESIARIGTQEESLDMPYQSSAPLGDSAAQFILNTFADLATRLRSMGFEPRTSETLRDAAIQGEIGVRVAIAEDVTAIDGTFYIHGISHTWMSDRKVVTRWWLVPADTSEYWILGTSELGINTRLSY